MYVSPILYIDIAAVVELILPFKHILNLPSFFCLLNCEESPYQSLTMLVYTKRHTVYDQKQVASKLVSNHCID